MNIYGKEASAYYDMHHGLRIQSAAKRSRWRYLARRTTPLVEELEEFAAAVRGIGKPEMGGEAATHLSR
jgi:hypothetical protein